MEPQQHVKFDAIFRSFHENRAKYNAILARTITSQQLQTALRPFFFKVHPDLFGQFPEQRAINERSLQILSAHLESLRSNRVPSSPSAIPFYLKNRDKLNPFRLVKVSMQRKDTKSFVSSILKTCDLETDYIEKIVQQQSPKRYSTGSSDSSSRPNVKYNVDSNEGQFSEEFDLFQFKVRKAREDETLEKFIKMNIDIAQIRTKSLDDLKEEVQKLKAELETKLQLKQILYNCGWNYEHFRGCLKSLEKLHHLYTNDMSQLHGKTIIFSQFTGVSLEGDIHLFTGDVQNNWLDVS